MDAWTQEMPQMEVMRPSDPLCRRYDLRAPHILLPVAFKGLARGILTIHRITSWRERPGECGVENKLGGAIRVEIKFSAEKGPLRGRTYNGEWDLGFCGPRFCWPQYGQPMPILIEFRATKLDLQPAAFLVAIERSESFGQLT
jgi:hypothetical protein